MVNIAILRRKTAEHEAWNGGYDLGIAATVSDPGGRRYHDSAGMHMADEKGIGEFGKGVVSTVSFVPLR